MPDKTIAVIGSGDVGTALSNGFLKHGFSVVRGSRDPSKLQEWLDGLSDESKGMASTATFEEASKQGDIVVLCVKGIVAEDVLDLCTAGNLNGKIVIDTTNPLADPFKETDGVVEFFTGPNDSLMERLQAKLPDAKFVKAFSCIGNAVMVDPSFENGNIKPTMFICGNDEEAKRTVTNEILTMFGWETADMGKVAAARAIEPLCQLWCLPGFKNGQWTHAFKLLK